MTHKGEESRLVLTTRIASEADLESLVRLAVALRDQLERPVPLEAEFRASIAVLLNDASTEFFLAWDAQKGAIGYVQARYRYSAWISALEVELEDVFVAPEARHRGVGLQLVQFAIDRAIGRNCRSMGLNTNERNEGALTLYRRLGFSSERSHWRGGRQLWLNKPLRVG